MRWTTPSSAGTRAASDLLEEIDGDNDRYPGVDLTVYMSQSPKKMFEEISRARAPQLAIGVAVVYVVAVLSQVSCKRSQSLARAAIIGTTMVIISNLCGYGFIGLLGIKLNHAMLQALPFIALGLGVDDMFLLLHYYRAIDPHVSVEVAIGELFREGGMSVTLTSLCNAISFFAGTVLPIPALRDFLLAAGLMVLFNYIIMVFAFPAVLAVEHKLRLQHLKEKAAVCLCSARRVTCDLRPASCLCLLSAFCFLLSAFCFLLSAFCFLLLLSAFCFLLSAFCFLLSAFCFLLSAFCFLLSAFCCPPNLQCCITHGHPPLCPSALCCATALCCPSSHFVTFGPTPSCTTPHTGHAR